jgi:hypothetical protein
MNRHILSLVLPALLLLGSACPAAAQWGPPPPYRDSGGWLGHDLSGTYINTSNGRACEVYRRGRDFVFVNENGTPARFAFVGPRTLELVRGDWNPDTVATLSRDRYGRRVIRFKEPGQPAGYWVRDE